MGKKDKNENCEPNKSILFPYYVNQGRLLDIYSIFNEGYSEYSEISTSAANTRKSGKDVNGSVSVGFKILSIGGGASYNSEDTKETTQENKEKKVQTVASILSSVIHTMNTKGYFCNIQDSKAGSYVCVPVVFSVNSVKALMSELTELLKLTDSIEKLDKTSNNKKNQTKDNKETLDVIKGIQTVFAGEEVLYNADQYAIIANITDDHLYQGVRSDIVDAEINCFGQVKRVFPNGTELMKNTIFSRVKDESAKSAVIQALSAMSENAFDFSSIAVSAINDKPVYQIEIVALFQ